MTPPGVPREAETPERDDPREPDDPAFGRLLTHLKDVRGFDFSGYKRPSLARRVRRRMDTVGLADFDEYVEQLETDPSEFTALFNTILINVTAFFRDAEAWDYLADRVVPLLLERHPGTPLRLWSAGCASGEEAYSLAMSFADVLGPEGLRDRVKIYATDVDEDALAYARRATYTERELGGVGEQRLERYFERDGSSWRVRPEVRRSVIFGRNDLLQDAPISHIDLLACRNTLMYFNAETQASILHRLHFALDPGGIMFLGKAEMLLSHAALYAPLEMHRRFFRKVGSGGLRDRLHVVQPFAGTPSDPSALDELRQAAFAAAPAAQLVVDRTGVLVLANEAANGLFGLGAGDLGAPFYELTASFKPVELRPHVHEAVTTGQRVWVRDVRWDRGSGGQLTFDVEVVPLGAAVAELGATMIFHDVTRNQQLLAELGLASRQLEHAYEELQSTNEELETTNEELQSTVEELETTNEELQSTNEELETMNAELQAMNDELIGSNDQLEVRTSDVVRLNTFMEAVLGSLEFGVAVIDLDRRVSAWNRRAEELWGIRTDEAVGRLLPELDIGLPLDEIDGALGSTLDPSVRQHHTIVLEAFNRRGRHVRVEVTVSPMRLSDAALGAILVMDVLDERPVG